MSAATQDAVVDVLELERTADFTLYGKTGWQFDAPAPQLGWWLGWVERPEGIFTFALNMDMGGGADATKRVPLGRDLLSRLHVLPVNLWTLRIPRTFATPGRATFETDGSHDLLPRRGRKALRDLERAAFGGPVEWLMMTRRGRGHRRVRSATAPLRGRATFGLLSAFAACAGSTQSFSDHVSFAAVGGVRKSVAKQAIDRVYLECDVGRSLTPIP